MLILSRLTELFLIFFSVSLCALCGKNLFYKSFEILTIKSSFNHLILFAISLPIRHSGLDPGRIGQAYHLDPEAGSAWIEVRERLRTRSGS